MPALLENIGRVVNWTGRKVGRAFGYDATRPKNKRRKVVALERSEDAELKQSDRSKVITTARDLPRNFTIAAWMVRKHLDYVSTFKFHCRHKNEEVNRKVEAFIKRWSKRKNCDVSGRFNLKRIIRMCEARRTLDGDVLIVKLADGRLQIIESDRVRTPVGGVPDTNPTDFTFGVKTRDGGEQVAFSVCKRAKVSDFGSSGQAFEFERIIPAANVYLHG